MTRGSRTVDWNAASASHPEYFIAHPDGALDIHHTEVGKTAYRNFIDNAVADAMASGC